MNDQPFRLDNRHALVTGGARGIGEATARELSRAGTWSNANLDKSAWQ